MYSSSSNYHSRLDEETHLKVGVVAPFGQKRFPVWAYFTCFSRRFRPGRYSVKCCLLCGEAERTWYSHDGAKAFIGDVYKINEAEWKLILVASSRSS